VEWMQRLDEARDNTSLPAHSLELEESFNAWLSAWVNIFYRGEA
jgi:hypothetical protein